MLKKYDNKKYEWYRDILSQFILISGILLVPISIEDVFQYEIIIFQLQTIRSINLIISMT